MIRYVLHGKIHRCKVTDACLNYEGSITVDEALLNASGIVEYEQVHVWNVNNGERFITYAIKGERNSGVICVNGSAARKVHIGDLLIIAGFAGIDFLNNDTKWTPKCVYVDNENRIDENKVSPII